MKEDVRSLTQQQYINIFLILECKSNYQHIMCQYSGFVEHLIVQYIQEIFNQKYQINVQHYYHVYIKLGKRRIRIDRRSSRSSHI